MHFMDTIKKIDKDTARQLRAALDKALDQVAAQFGLESVTIGNMTMSTDGGSVTTKLIAKVKPEHNKLVMQQLHQQSQLLGYSTNIYGKTLKNRGATYIVTGFDLGRRKFPILAKNVETGAGCAFPNPSGGLKFDDKTITWSAVATVSRIGDIDYSDVLEA